MNHPNGHRESRARRERCVGATKLKVEAVSLAEQDASHGINPLSDAQHVGLGRSSGV